jgi:hypothetical protein
MHIKGSSTMIRNEINIFNLTNRIKKIDLIGFFVFKEWSLNAFQNSQWTIHLEEQDPLKT